MKKHTIGILIIAATLLSGHVFPGNCRAAELKANLQLDSNITEVGDPVSLGIVFEGVQGIPAPKLPKQDGLTIQYLGPSTVMSIVNGKMSSSITHRYQMIALKSGDYTLGPYTFKEGKNTYRTEAVKLRVVGRGQLPGQNNAQTASSGTSPQPAQNLNDLIFVKVSAGVTHAYINQLIPISVKLFIRGVSVRDVHYPVFSGSGFVQDKFDKPTQYRQQLNGEIYNVVEFRTRIYAAKEGRIDIGPVKVKCNLIVTKKTRHPSSFDDFFDMDQSFFGDFFSQVKVVPVNLQSKDLALDVSDFPQENRPKDFSGAVGSFRMGVTCDPKKVKAGDPISMDMAIAGDGNFDSVQNPELVSSSGFKVYPPEVKSKDGEKIFEQVIIPQKAALTKTPAVRFSYFDPDQGKYVTLSNPPISIQVSAPAQSGAELVDESGTQKVKNPETEVVGKDILYIKEDPGRVTGKGQYLYQNTGFVLLQVLPILIFLPVYFLRKRKDRLRSDVRYARKVKAPKIARRRLKNARMYLEKGRSAEFYDQVFKTMQEYLGHRFNYPTASITVEILDVLNKKQNFRPEIIEKLKKCFNECDIARYTGITADRKKMEGVLNDLIQAIEYFERKKT